MLREQIGLTDQGTLRSLRRALAFVSLLPPVGSNPFVPVEMARDVLRLERFYQQQGFASADADWHVELDTARNVVDVTYSISEGPPLVIRSLAFVTAEGADPVALLPRTLRPEWQRHVERIESRQRETRLDELSRIEIESASLEWLRERGYPFATAESRTQTNEAQTEAEVEVRLSIGPRAQIRRVEVEGTERLQPGVIRRELPFREGDLFDGSKLIGGQREVLGLNAVQLALVDVPDQPHDSTVTVRVRVRENRMRARSAQLGYFSEVGITGQAQWEHYNFLGGARTLTASALANTDLGTFSSTPQKRYVLRTTLRQPYAFDRRIALTAGPYAEIEDDALDRSNALGGDVALTYEVAPLRSVALDYNLELKDVSELRATVFGNVLDLFSTLVEEQLAGRRHTSSLSLSGVFGVADDPVQPNRGVVLRPSLDVVLPFARPRSQFGRVSMAVGGVLPVTPSLSVKGRLHVGQLVPLGDRREPLGPGSDSQEVVDALADYLNLYDRSFFAGGVADVRGWAADQLGAKLPDLTEIVVDGQTTLGSNNRYVPIGGYGKAVGSLEVRLALGAVSVFTFLDAGRLWVEEDYDIFGVNRPDDTGPGTFPDDYNQFFFGTGLGVDLATPVGPAGVALGFKLNPSNLDVRSPQAVGEYLVQSLIDPSLAPPLESIPPEFARRFQLHLQIGHAF